VQSRNAPQFAALGSLGVHAVAARAAAAGSGGPRGGGSLGAVEDGRAAAAAEGRAARGEEVSQLKRREKHTRWKSTAGARVARIR
jgi:hypothetical protein